MNATWRESGVPLGSQPPGRRTDRDRVGRFPQGRLGPVSEWATIRQLDVSLSFSVQSTIGHPNSCTDCKGIRIEPQ
jgi:hypothetical protein